MKTGAHLRCICNIADEGFGLPPPQDSLIPLSNNGRYVRDNLEAGLDLDEGGAGAIQAFLDRV